MLPPGVILELKIHQNAFAARALAPDPTGGVFYSAPRPYRWFSRGASWQERGGKERAGKRGRGWKGKGREASPILLFTISLLDTKSHNIITRNSAVADKPRDAMA